MCMMCEQEALYDAYLEYVARKDAEAAGKGKTPFKAQTFSAESIDDEAAHDTESAPNELTAVHVAPATTAKEN